jgi:hypothetical protein
MSTQMERSMNDTDAMTEAARTLERARSNYEHAQHVWELALAAYLAAAGWRPEGVLGWQKEAEDGQTYVVALAEHALAIEESFPVGSLS